MTYEDAPLVSWDELHFVGYFVINLFVQLVVKCRYSDDKRRGASAAFVITLVLWDGAASGAAESDKVNYYSGLLLLALATHAAVMTTDFAYFFVSPSVSEPEVGEQTAAKNLIHLVMKKLQFFTYWSGLLPILLAVYNMTLIGLVTMSVLGESDVAMVMLARTVRLGSDKIVAVRGCGLCIRLAAHLAVLNYIMERHVIFLCSEVVAAHYLVIHILLHDITVITTFIMEEGMPEWLKSRASQLGLEAVERGLVPYLILKEFVQKFAEQISTEAQQRYQAYQTPTSMSNDEGNVDQP